MQQSGDIPAQRRADAVANRAALLRAASALYAEHGAEVPFEDIAQAAGVGRATVYRHFPNREQLHIAILEEIVEEIEKAAVTLPRQPAAFMALFGAALKIQTDHLPLVDLLPPDRRPTDAVRALRARVHAVFREPLALAQESGFVRNALSPEDVRVQLLMLSAVVRPETPAADQRRAWRLAQAALGVDDARPLADSRLEGP
jgi:AcrR family transcriptional regulator